MAWDHEIGHGAPGIAGFESENFHGPREPLINGSLGEVARWHVSVGGDVDLPIYSVVGYDGTTIALATDGGTGVQAPYGILMSPVKTGTGEATTVEVAFSGMWDMDALNWDASFDTDEKKRTAFEGSVHPTIFMGKRNPKDSAHRV
jgi:hypothetical protein